MLYNYIIIAWLTILQNKLEELYISEEPLSFYQKRQLDFEKQCRLLNIELNSPEAEELRKKTLDTNNNLAKSNASTNLAYDEVWIYDIWQDNTDNDTYYAYDQTLLTY